MSSACLLIACKLNEVKKPRAVDIAFFTDSACTTKEICDMELKICVTLKFNLQVVTAYHFLDRFLDASHFTYGMSSNKNDFDVHWHGQSDASQIYVCSQRNPKLQAMALFTIDTALFIPALVDIKDSAIAAASLYLARALVGVRDKDGMIWNEQLAYHTGYTMYQLSDIVSLLHLYQQKEGDVEGTTSEDMKGLLKKYKNAEYHHVAYKTAIPAQDLKLP